MEVADVGAGSDAERGLRVFNLATRRRVVKLSLARRCASEWLGHLFLKTLEEGAPGRRGANLDDAGVAAKFQS